tara:strand:+ start:15105 stop:17381 length:2277 start_codon:yes stop_codon:yes gene_type:complete
LFFSAQVIANDVEEPSKPSVFHVTTAETLPGDAVLVRGEFLDQVERVQISRLADKGQKTLPQYIPQPREDQPIDLGGTDKSVAAESGKKVQNIEMIQQNSQSLKFIVPADWEEGIYSVQLQSGKNVSSFYLNVPKVIWAISEEGLKATIGDYLRIQGKNLFRIGQIPSVMIVSNKGSYLLNFEKAFDEYSVRVNVPSDIPPGQYHLYYHNGFGGGTTWSEPLEIEVVKKSAKVWDQKRFNVRDFGAVGDGEHNETAAFRLAINTAKEAGGGTVYVPRGRYMLTGGLILPPHTLLLGESKELTQVFWNPLNWDTGEMPESLIYGSHHFGVKDLNLWASRAWGVIMQKGDKNGFGHVMLENLIVRQSNHMSGLMSQVKTNRDLVTTEFQMRWSQTGIVLSGENVIIRNCDFNSNGMYSFNAVSGFIQNCKFTRNEVGFTKPFMKVHPKGLIYEDCLKNGKGFGYASSIDESMNLYEARNIIEFDYTNDREVMTYDGGSGAYTGPIGKIEGTTLTLPENAETYRWIANKWIGGGLFILDGTGSGQFRRIVSHTLDEIVLDHPFVVNPDQSSIISITTIRNNLIFVNNEAKDCGAYQLYGSAQNAVISGIKMKRSSGIVSRGSRLYHGTQPNWYAEIINCDLNDGNYSHWFGIDDRGHSGHQSINLIGSGGSGMNLGTLIRRNRLSDFSYIRTSPGASPNAVTDAIIERNSFRTANTAILLGGRDFHTSRILIHDNDYSDVETKVGIRTGLDQSAFLIVNKK